jgi:hypothetical protein
LLQPEFEAIHWQAFCRLALDRQPADEVAASLGLPLAAVFLAQARVLQRLRREFENFVDV